MSEFASSSGHWYTRTGEPAYDQPNKSKPGEFRPSTLADAKKLLLVPSVTTVLDIAAKPALENWKRNQILMAAATMPIKEGESSEDYIKRLITDSEAEGIAARDRGTLIHGWVEAYFEGQLDIPDEAWPWIDAVENALDREFGAQDWISEKSFASPLGYGGKVDLHSSKVLVDFKTKETAKIDFKKSMTWPDNHMQLAAYRRGLYEDWKGIKMANVYIGRELVDGKAVVKLETHDTDYWDHFKCLLDYWRLTKNYDPSF